MATNAARLQEKKSMSALPARAAFSDWRDAVCSNLVDVEIEHRGTDFWGDFSYLPIGHAGLSELSGTAMWVQRSNCRIGSEGGSDYLVNIMVDGAGRTAQNGNEFALQPGDIFIQNASHPYSIMLDTSFRIVTLRVPQKLIERYFVPYDQVCAQPLSRKPGIGRVAASTLLSLAENIDSLDPQDGELVVGNTLTMLGAACAAIAPHAPRTAPHANFARISHFINLNLSHPELGSTMIARACSVTVRQLNRLFENEQETVLRVILRRRLERCRLDLLSRNLANRTISEIAYHWGFNSLSHFSDAFRRAYGITAGKLRENRFTSVQ